MKQSLIDHLNRIARNQGYTICSCCEKPIVAHSMHNPIDGIICTDCSNLFWLLSGGNWEIMDKGITAVDMKSSYNSLMRTGQGKIPLYIRKGFKRERGGE